MDSVIGTTLGRYRLIERIGRGGMATVYVAEPMGGHARVAIKLLTPLMSDNEQFTQRFRQEARVVARLKHPNIIPVIDYGEIDGKAYLVMPYHPSGSLSDRLAQGSVKPEEGGRIIAQISAALQFAHEHGVIHRDVKPSNVLLDEQGNGWLSDFGLAYMYDASLSLTGSGMLGTPAYVSPEQARGSKASARSDQYSLGIVLFEMVTGQLPFEAETPMGVLVKHMQTPIPLPRSIKSGVPVHIERVILKATAKDPDDRFGSVAEMNAAFQASLAHALDPSVHPAPTLIPVPPSHPTIPLPDSRDIRIGARRVRPWQLGAAATLLALLVCLPSAYAGMFLLPGSAATAPQLTAQAATIEALSAQLSASQGGLSEAEVRGAVMQTMTALQAGDGSGRQSLALGQPGGLLPGVFPALFGGGTPTPNPQATLGVLPAGATLPNGGGASPNSATPTRTPYGAPTSTFDPSATAALPGATSTSPSASTSTPVPPTSMAQPTNTPQPPPTNTPQPPPTNTPQPPPTSTPAPPATSLPPTEVKICKKKPHQNFPTCEPD